jgi:hypothetical protein
MQQLYARTEFFDRQQSQILSNFVRYFFLRLIVVVHGWHGWPPAAENLATAAMVVTSPWPA